VNEDYSDIIGLPHYEPVNHKRMPLAERAAQFAPYAALGSPTPEITSPQEEQGQQEEDCV
jgi:hypothetical protein